MEQANKIIFLDMDGVMNSSQAWNYWHEYRGKSDQWWEENWGGWNEEGSIDPDEMTPYESQLDLNACANLYRILKKYPETRIVISSTWRHRRYRTTEWWNKYFKKWKIFTEDKVIGKTPSLSAKDRGDEIKAWLDETNLTVDNFCILDDDSDMSDYLHSHHFIQTQGEVGFDYFIYEKVDHLFGGFSLSVSDLKKGIGYRCYCRGGKDTVYFFNGEDELYYYNEENEKVTGIKFGKNEKFALAK